MNKILQNIAIFLCLMFIIGNVTINAFNIHPDINKDFISNGKDVSFSFFRKSDLLTKMSVIQWLKQHPFLNHNSWAVEYVVHESSKVSIHLTPSKFLEKDLWLLLRLPKANQQYWTFTNFYSYSGNENDIRISYYRRENGNDFQLYEETVKKKRFISVNLWTNDKSLAYRDLYIKIEKLNPKAKWILRIQDPRANSKENVFYNKSIVNFINFTTLVNLSQEQNIQLKELYNAGHKTWVLWGIRNDVEKNSDIAFDIIKSHETLSKVKIVLGVQNIISNDFCEYAEYVEWYNGTNSRWDPVILRNGTAFNQEPIAVHKIWSWAPLHPDSLHTTYFLQNCATITSEEFRTEQDQKLVNHLDQYKTVARKYRDMISWVFLFDEPAHRWVPESYQKDIYHYFNVTLPNKTIINVRSFYIGFRTIANKYQSEEIIQEYFNPNTADVVLYDHYSVSSLFRGSTKRTEDMYNFLYENQMLNKPFVKLYSGLIRDTTWSCDIDLEDGSSRNKTIAEFKSVFDLTEQVLNNFWNWANDRITAARNGANMWYWAFFNAEAFSTSQASWDSTLAHQNEWFCENQYKAVLEKSHNFSK